MDDLIPKEIQFDGDWPWVTFKNTSKVKKSGMGLAVSRDVGGLTLVATWVRTDSFTLEGRKSSSVSPTALHLNLYSHFANIRKVDRR